MNADVFIHPDFKSKCFSPENLFMRNNRIIIIFVLVLFGALPAWSYEFAAESGLVFDAWRNSDNTDGNQYHIPLKFEVTNKNFSTTLLTGYCKTTIAPDMGERQSLDGILDSKLNFSYQLPRNFPIDVLLGMGFNLPTGKTGLSTKDLMLTMNSDLVSITGFGEGFNANPTLTVAGEWGDLVWGLGGGYIWRGEYDYSESLSDYDPGDIFSLTSELQYYINPAMITRLFAEYCNYGRDEVDGEDILEEGDFFLIGTGIKAGAGKWTLDLDIKTILRARSRFISSSGLAEEDRNSHGDEWVSACRVSYRLSDRILLKPSVSYLFIDENDYAVGSGYHVGSRNKFNAGFGVEYNVGKCYRVLLDLTGFHIRDDKSWSHPDNDLTYDGFSMGLTLNSRF